MLIVSDTKRHKQLQLTSRKTRSNAYINVFIFTVNKGVNPYNKTRAKQAQACNTAPCLRISDIFT